MTVSQGRAAGAAQLIRRRAGTIAYLAKLQRLSPDWPRIARAKLRPGTALPPIRLRDGTVLHHGPLDDPVLMLHEVHVAGMYGVEEMPPDGALMLDLGANIGAVSLFHLARAPGLRAHAYEPNPASAAVLRENMERNGLSDRATVHVEGVGDGVGELELWVGGPSHESSAYSDTPPAGHTHRVTVPIVGLDDAWRRAGGGPIWLLKVDTEGAELDILTGASPEALAAVRHAIVETHDDLVPGALDMCRTLLTQAGLRIARETVFPWNQALLHATRA